jgi:phospholipid-binding lipoprotein MlaA
VLFAVLALGLGGCAGLASGLHDPSGFAERPPEPSLSEKARAEVAGPTESRTENPGHEPLTPAEESNFTDARAATAPAAETDAVQIAQRTAPGQPPAPDDQIEEYDPWEPFNEAMFEFNRGLDRWVVKPVAKGYNVIMPDPLQEMMGNGFDNIRFVPRFVNSLLQGKFAGAGRELGRFLINSTLGIGGLFDVAKTEFSIEKSNEDAGQTLGVWGVGPGPFLILPFLPPLTVRDGIGFAADMAMDPLGYVLPFFWERAGMKVGDTINDRSLNLDLFQSFEEATVEFYSALRNAYLQRRHKLIRE